jgi:hypothetical protein
MCSHACAIHISFWKQASLFRNPKQWLNLPWFFLHSKACNILSYRFFFCLGIKQLQDEFEEERASWLNNVQSWPHIVNSNKLFVKQNELAFWDFRGNIDRFLWWDQLFKQFWTNQENVSLFIHFQNKIIFDRCIDVYPSTGKYQLVPF